MPLSETELEQMSYREVVELAKVNGVYQKKSAKKATLIRRLSTVFSNDEFSGIENIDPNRTGTLTPLKEVDESLVQDSDCEGQERRKTFTKAKKATMRKASVPEVLTDPPKRQNTFTQSDTSTSGLTTSKIEVTRASKKSSSQEDKPMTPLTRQNTFTKDEPENMDETKSQDSGSILTTAPGKDKNDIPVLQLNTVQTPPPIEKLSVFQRLSAKIPLSERRSLVLPEKRVSVKTNFFTPQADKRSQLNALREARKNHITPRSLTRTLNGTASTMKTPVQPTIKSSATSTKKSSVKKPPNFAEIHKRHFAKMESLLEHKKRLRERAELMSPARRTQMSSSIPKRVETSTGVPKPGVKHSNIPVLLKKAATKDRLKLAMAKKCPTGVAAMHAKDKKILKGVRMNKRFQLQLALKQKKT